MTRLVIAAVLALCVFAGSVFAAGETIRGQITQTPSNEPVPFATVQIEGTRLGVAADSLGFFEIRHAPCGEITLMVSAAGFEPHSATVTVEHDIETTTDVQLTAARIDVGSIVVTGTRMPRFIKDAPVFTEVISRASIEDKTAHNIYEALDGESGVRVEQQCQGCNFSILRMQGLGADHTQILLDGQPVYSGLTSVYGLQQMSTADVAQIEIVKGAGSALYGSNAVAGAINIVSAVPRTTEGRIGLEFGEYGTNKYEITASSRKDNMGVFVFAQQNEQNEIDETGDVNAPGGVDNPDGWLDRVRSTSKNAGFNLFLDDVFSSDQLVFRGRALSEVRKGGWLTDNLFENPFAAGSERIITDRFSAGAEYHLWLRNGTEINASLTFTSNNRNATNDVFLDDYEETVGETPSVELLRPFIADEKMIVGNLGLVQPWGGKHLLLAGVQTTWNQLEESGVYLDSDTQEAYESSSTKEAIELGVYVQDEYRVTNKLEIVAGLRFDYHTSEDEFRGSGNVLSQGLEPLEYDESSINPRLSVKYAASDALVLRGSLGTGYRVPYGFSEDLHLCSGSPRVYKGGDLKPEKSRSISVSADYTKSRWSSSVNLYRTELEDAISFADADDDVAELGYTYEWQNIDNAWVMGAEFNGAYSLTEELALGLRFELFKGEYDNAREDWTGTQYEEISKNISRFPKTSGGLKIEFTPREWSFIADANYKGKMYIDLTEPANEDDIKIHETETFVLFNAKVQRTIGERYTLYVGAQNLGDYTQEEKHIDDAAFMYAPVYGQTLYGGLQISL